MTNIPISAFKVSEKSYPILVPFSIAIESLKTAAVSFIELTDDEGNTGIGEAAPFPSLTYDTVQDASQILRQAAPTLVGLTPEAALTQLGPMADNYRQKSVTAYCAIECAILDLKAKQMGIPLARLHGNADVSAIETDITVPIMPAEGVEDFFQLFSQHDFRTIKIKVSGNLSQDIEVVRTIRHVFPKGVTLTLDGNQGFDVPRAVALVDGLAKEGIVPDFFEQPLPEKDWPGIKQLAACLPTRLCLDETIRTVADTRKLIAEGIPAIINLKIMKSGLLETRAIMELARAHNIPLMIGGMLESEVAMGHSLHLACGVGGVSYFDLDTPFFFRSSPAVSSPWSNKSRVLRCPQEKGLGIDIVPV